MKFQLTAPNLTKHMLLTEETFPSFLTTAWWMQAQPQSLPPTHPITPWSTPQSGPCQAICNNHKEAGQSWRKVVRRPHLQNPQLTEAQHLKPRSRYQPVSKDKLFQIPLEQTTKRSFYEDKLAVKTKTSLQLKTNFRRWGAQLQNRFYSIFTKWPWCAISIKFWVYFKCLFSDFAWTWGARHFEHSKIFDANSGGKWAPVIKKTFWPPRNAKKAFGQNQPSPRVSKH